MTKLPTDNVLRLCDTNRGALLLCQGVELLDAQTNESGNLEFVFSNEGDKAKIASAALMDNRLLPIRDFLDAARRLREMVFQHRLINKGGSRKRGPEVL